MKKVIKIIVILIMFLSINVVFASISNAEGENSQTFDDAVTEANDFVTKGSELFSDPSSGVSTDKLTDPIKPIAKALRTIGIGIILCIGAYMGIKWVTAKPDEQAKLKQQSIGLAVAAVVVIGATSIWEIVLNIVSKL